jgi:chromosome segregation ATPase
MLEQNALLAAAQDALAAAQKDLEIALSDYEAELADDVAKNKILDKYLVSYKAAIADANALQVEIIGLQESLFKAEFYALDSDLAITADILEKKELEKSKLERTLDLNEGWLAKAEAVYGNTADRHAVINDVREIKEQLELEIDAKDVEIEKLDGQMNAKKKAYENALVAYGAAMDAEDKIEAFTDGVGGTIPQEVLETLTDTPNDAAAFYSSLDTYNTQLEAVTEVLTDLMDDRTDANSSLTRIKALKNTYATALTNAETAVETAKANVEAAQHNLNMAELQLATDPTNDTYQANVTTRNDELTTANTALDTAESNLANLISEINGSPLLASNYYPGAVVNNIEEIDELITLYEEALEVLGDAIADKQEVVGDLNDDIAVVNGYITYLQTIEVGDVAALKAIYFAARSDYFELLDQIDVLDINKGILVVDLASATSLEASLEGDYDDINTFIDARIDDIAGIKADIANLDADFATWDSYVAALGRKIEQKQVELAIREKEAAYYKALIDLELE